jgi:hypothetical protein
MLDECRLCPTCRALAKRIERLQLELATERDAFRRYREQIANRKREVREKYMLALGGR